MEGVSKRSHHRERDLYAVLTPCGPLKLLVEEIHQPNAPAMTKLLYETNLMVARPPLGETLEAQGPDAAKAQRARKTAKKERKAARRQRSKTQTTRAKEAAAAAKSAVAAVITRSTDTKICTNFR